MQNPVRRQAFAVSAELNRLLLNCRFDFRQKTWGLPMLDGRRGFGADVDANASELARTLARILSRGFNASLKEVSPSKALLRRIGLRPAPRRSLQRTKQPKNKHPIHEEKRP